MAGKRGGYGMGGIGDEKTECVRYQKVTIEGRLNG